MTRGSMPSLAGKGNHDAKYAGLNHGSARMLTPFVSRKKPAWPRNVIRIATEDTGGTATRPMRVVAYHEPSPPRRRTEEGHGRRGLVRRRVGLRRAGAAQCAGPGAARGDPAL